MSGVVKGIKKVFKAVAKVVKKVIKPLAIAAAVYFTGGLALSAFPATAGFAASLPGFGISATGAATGIFSKAAAVIGLDGGLVAGAAATAGAAAGAATTTAAVASGGFGGIGGAATGGAAAAGGGGAVGAGIGAGAGAATTAAGTTAAAAGMTLTEKLMLASIGSKAIGGFLAPTMSEQYTEAKRWRGAYYGTYANGTSDAAPPSAVSQQPATPAQQIVSPAKPVGAAPPTQAKPTRELMSSMPRQTVNTTPAMPEAPKVAQAPIENAPIEAKKLMQEGVRYV